MDVTGKIKVIMDKMTFDSGFEKQEFVVTTREQYPQDIKIELIKDKINILKDFQVGDEVRVDINLRGNEYNGRYFVNIQGWRMEKLGAGASNAAPAPQDVPWEVQNQAETTNADNGDDLPF